MGDRQFVLALEQGLSHEGRVASGVLGEPGVVEAVGLAGLVVAARLMGVVVEVAQVG